MNAVHLLLIVCIGLVTIAIAVAVVDTERRWRRLEHKQHRLAQEQELSRMWAEFDGYVTRNAMGQPYDKDAAEECKRRLTAVYMEMYRSL